MSDNNSDNDDNGGWSLRAHDYYIFFAIALIIASVVAIFFYRKKRGLRVTYARRSAIETEGRVNAAVHQQVLQNRAARRRAMDDLYTEEGLNEAGEAPPPYLPKAHAGDTTAQSHPSVSGEAIPLQTLPPIADGGAPHTNPPGYDELTRFPAATRNSRPV